MSISPTALHKACTQLYEAFQASTSRDFEDVRLISDWDTKYLQLTKRISRTPAGSLAAVGDEHHDTEHDENDEEALVHERPTAQQTLVIYDVFHSPSYQVPVLYIRFRNFFEGGKAVGMPSSGQIYELLVPASQRAPMREVGVMGALSLADHPISGFPAYFVHPCRTADAMTTTINNREVSPVEYLMLWLGVIGNSVDLNIPVDVASAISS